MQSSIYQYLATILRTRPIHYPTRRSFPPISAFVPQHLKCHLTAAQVAVELGLVPVVGIQFLELHAKLYPWPHMVSLDPMVGMVDYSPKPDQRSLGFIETGWHEWKEWRCVTIEYEPLASVARASSWGDPLADALSDEFMPPLRSNAPF